MIDEFTLSIVLNNHTRIYAFQHLYSVIETEGMEVIAWRGSQPQVGGDENTCSSDLENEP